MLVQTCPVKYGKVFPPACLPLCFFPCRVCKLTKLLTLLWMQTTTYISAAVTLSVFPPKTLMYIASGKIASKVFSATDDSVALPASMYLVLRSQISPHHPLKHSQVLCVPPSIVEIFIFFSPPDLSLLLLRTRRTAPASPSPSFVCSVSCGW